VTLRLLVFGESGQVATELRRRAGPDLDVTALDREAADLGDADACAAKIAACDADVVVNAAAYTAVDRAESEEAIATRINGDAPGAMARAAAARSLPFLHLSTDYVFDGRSDRPWREDDQVNPLGAYARSKLAGERAVTAADGAHAILRTSWVFADHGANFVRTMVRAGAVRDRLTVVADQHGAPTAAADIADALVAIARAFAAGRGVSGTFHFSGAPPTTWHGFAVEIFRQLRWPRTPEIAAIATEDWPTPTPRPAYTVLDCAKIEKAYGLAQPDWRAALGRVLAELQEDGDA
jgi:dTDP-4-dehydrorhamnose reductase